MTAQVQPDPVGAGASSRTGTIPALDTMRAIAALAVVITHVGFQTGATGVGLGGAVIARLDIGVAIFFVLSGFLLSREFLAPEAHPDLRLYALKRVLRIYPVYVVAVVLAMVVIEENRGLGASEWVRQLTLTQVYWGAELPEGLTQMWSLSTEVAFYVLLPVLAYALVRTRARFGVGGMLVLLAALSVGGLVWLAGGGPALFGADARTNLWLPGYALWFAIGIAMAQAWHRRRGSAPAPPVRLLTTLAATPGACWLAAAALLLVAATPLAGPTLLFPATGAQLVVKTVLYGASAGLLILPLALGDPTASWSRWLASRPLRYLGHISYSLFCIHLVVLHLVLQGTGIEPFTGHFPTVLTTTVAVSLLASALVYRLIERPAMSWGRRRASRPAPTAIPTDSSASS